jgi:predicted amidohydrolase
LRVAACQTPEILGDVEAALRCIEGFAGQEADLLLFPEAFLQGYLVTAAHLRAHALDLGGPEFAGVLRRLARVEQTLVFGVIEVSRGRYFNSAVVTARGELIGVYRKTHLVPGEAAFDRGVEYPVFDLHGIRCGINICADTRFADAAAAVAAQGARLLLVPAQNMMRRSAAEHWKDRHNRIRQQRVRETGMWLASSDVTGTRNGSGPSHAPGTAGSGSCCVAGAGGSDCCRGAGAGAEDRVGYGPTCVIDPTAAIVAQVPSMSIGVALADII